ncbi:hypothetical protein NP493_1693g00014 [Ridgeia piscesae]|uniref:Uncharacterized protein n=1 Tax=Ridgeia piscesae TaxID=27915 RepID=A0AAD9JUW0_RIDPI|nr:hypothetical protein NP493_1693g00014 [Ridgeia piscesae]
MSEESFLFANSRYPSLHVHVKLSFVSTQICSQSCLLLSRSHSLIGRHIPSFSSVPAGQSLHLNDLPLEFSSSGVTSVQFVPLVQGLS